MVDSGPRSVRSDRVGAIRRLSNKSFRHQVQRFLVEGPQGVREAVHHHPDHLDELFVVPDCGAAVDEIADAAAGAGVKVTSVDERVLLAMTETVHPQGVAAVSRFVEADEVADLLPDSQLIVVLHDVRDPGNAGTILRTADAAGADGVVFSGDSVDPYNGKCVRSSAGSLFHVPFVRGADLSDALHSASTAGLQVLATSGAGSANVFELQRAGELDKPTVWVFGNEARGLPPHESHSTLVDREVAIPLFGAAESLNLAAAAAICLYASAVAQDRA